VGKRTIGGRRIYYTSTFTYAQPEEKADRAEVKERRMLLTQIGPTLGIWEFFESTVGK